MKTILKNVAVYAVPAVALTVACFYVYQFTKLSQYVVSDHAVVQALTSVDASGVSGWDKAVVTTINKYSQQGAVKK